MYPLSRPWVVYITEGCAPGTIAAYFERWWCYGLSAQYVATEEQGAQ